MSDFDNFDDLDAVRDFRAGVGLLTPQIDDRIRRRIIDLAIARGLVDGTDGRDEIAGAGSGVLELPADGGHPPISTSADSSSSDGSAAVVELPVAARPPARQPRWLVAAAAIVVVILVAGVALVSRRGGNDEINTAIPPNATTSSQAPPPVVSTFDDLVQLIGRGEDHVLGARTFQRTVDRITKPREGSGAEPGTESYLLTQERSTGKPRLTDISDATFTPPGRSAEPFDPPKPSGIAAEEFEGLSYLDVRGLATVTSAEGMHQRIADVQGPGVPLYNVLAAELGLLRLAITPPQAKVLLAQALLLSGYQQVPSEQSDAAKFKLVLAGDGDTVTVTFKSADGTVQSWVQERSDGTSVSDEVIESRVVS